MVIGAGGHNIIRMIGCIEKLINTNHLKLKDIEHIYATSAGAVISAYLCLDLDWNILSSYLMNKPWGKRYENTPSTLLSAFHDLGIFGNEFVKDILEIQFKMKGLNINTITFKELYDYSKKKINVYVFNVNKFECECFNYELTPDMKLLDGIYMSTTFPFMFKPIWMNNTYYLDGGLHLDFPYIKALEDGMDEDCILSIKMFYPEREYQRLDRETNMLEMITYLLEKFILESRKKFEDNINPKRLILIHGNKFNMDAVKNSLEKDNVKKMIYEGRDSADKFLNENVYKTELTNSVKVSAVGSASNSVTESPLTK